MGHHALDIYVFGMIGSFFLGLGILATLTILRISYFFYDFFLYQTEWFFNYPDKLEERIHPEYYELLQKKFGSYVGMVIFACRCNHIGFAIIFTLLIAFGVVAFSVVYPIGFLYLIREIFFRKRYEMKKLVEKLS